MYGYHCGVLSESFSLVSVKADCELKRRGKMETADLLTNHSVISIIKYSVIQANNIHEKNYSLLIGWEKCSLSVTPVQKV